MKRFAIFDLDGTLTDSAPGIIKSIRYALKKMGAPSMNRKELMRFVGPPLADSFRDFCGFSNEEAALGIKYYRERFAVKGIYENSVFEGVPEMLKGLRQEGVHLIVGTSKPELFALKVIDHFGLTEYFDEICGSDMAETRSSKAEVLQYAIEKAGIEDLSCAVMVGDRKYDVTGARAVGLDAIGVLYGYGGREELLDAGAWAVAEDPEQVKNIIIARAYR